ncbi:MAG: VCBS repeat-containing protein, partial [Chrysiogenetes bacterium]|nr:VCBS repeat-containing protein [Chrysiogenetes bacterium]
AGGTATFDDLTYDTIGFVNFDVVDMGMTLPSITPGSVQIIPPAFGLIGGATINQGAALNAIAAGDTDLDGDIDVAAVSTASDIVYTHLNQGNSTFAPFAGVAVGDQPVDVVLADFNHDGLPDIATANAGVTSLSVALNNGAGFDSAVGTTLAGGASTLAVGHLDSDGNLDMVVGHSTADAYVLTGNGAGMFSGVYQVSAVNDTQQVAIEDLDHDGDGDVLILAGTGAAARLRVFFNASLVFTESTSSPYVATNSDSTAFGLADFNNDGFADVMISSPSGVQRFINDGNGDFAIFGTTGTAESTPVWSEAVDVDGDRNQDLLVLHASSQLSLMLGDGSGNLSEENHSPFPANMGVNDGALLDIDGNGRVDLAVSLDTANEIDFYGNNAPEPKAVSIGTGFSTTCLVDAMGDGYCTGSDNVSGTLGNGNPIADVQQPDPVDTTNVTGTGRWLKIDPGSTVSCGLTIEHDAYCWGNAALVGDNGGPNPAPEPQAVATGPIGGSTKFADIQVGNGSICGLMVDGDAYCWGLDNNNELGNGPGTATLDIPSAVDTTNVVGSGKFKKIAIGTDHGCAISREGDAYCWGSNANDRLGDGSGTNQDIPVQVDTTNIGAGSTEFVDIAPGGSQTCGLMSDGVVYCWGNDTPGALGNGAGTNSETTPTTPVDTGAITGYKDFREIEAGNQFTCGILADGRSYCWGADGNGELGNDPAFSNADSPVKVDVTGLPSNQEFKLITPGVTHTCGLAYDGSAWCWGLDDAGQLGGTLGDDTSGVPAPVTGF